MGRGSALLVGETIITSGFIFAVVAFKLLETAKAREVRCWQINAPSLNLNERVCETQQSFCLSYKMNF